MAAADGLTGASLGHRLPGALTRPDGGQHHLVERAGFEGQEAVAGGVGVHALVLDDAAVVDQHDAVRVQLPGGSLPPRLQAVGAAAVGDLQLGDLGRSWKGPGERVEMLKDVLLLRFLAQRLF